MKAREMFTIGQRVRMSREALDRGLDGRRVKRSTGEVVGFGHQPHTVAVIVDGQKTRVAYHMSFWEADDTL